MRRQTAKKQELLGEIDAKTAARLIGSCSDIALLLDAEGVVLDVIVQDAALAALGKLVQKQVSPMRTTVTPSNYRRLVAAMQAQRLLRELAGEPRPH